MAENLIVEFPSKLFKVLLRCALSVLLQVCSYICSLILGVVDHGKSISSVRRNG